MQLSILPDIALLLEVTSLGGWLMIAVDWGDGLTTCKWSGVRGCYNDRSRYGVTEWKCAPFLIIRGADISGR